MRGHAAVGGDLRRAHRRLRAPRTGGRARSHERWDGGGYPDGLTGEGDSRSRRASLRPATPTTRSSPTAPTGRRARPSKPGAKSCAASRARSSTEHAVDALLAELAEDLRSLDVVSGETTRRARNLPVHRASPPRRGRVTTHPANVQSRGRESPTAGHTDATSARRSCTRSIHRKPQPAMQPPTPQIVALGGGGFSMEQGNPLLDDYVLSLTGQRARACASCRQPQATPTTTSCASTAASPPAARRATCRCSAATRAPAASRTTSPRICSPRI